MANGKPAKAPARSESRLKTWLRDHMGRREAPPQAQKETPEPQKETPEQREPSRPSEAATGTNESRGAALSSHPVTGHDLAQMQSGRRRPSTAPDLAPQPSAEERAETGGTGTSAMRIVPPSETQEPEPATNGVTSHHDNNDDARSVSPVSDPGHHGVHHHDAERAQQHGDLRERAAEQGLPPPLEVREASTARESRFSEDL